MEIFKLWGRILVDNEDANRKITDTDQRAEATGRTFQNMIGTVAKWGAAVAAGAAAAGAALGGLVSRATQTATTIVKYSQTVNFSTRAYQEWDHVMRQVGWSMQQASNNLANFTERIMQAAGGSGEAAAAFRELGVRLTDETGKLRSSEAVFEDVIAALQNMEDITKRNAIAGQLLGNTAEEIAPILNMTAEELAQLRASAHVIDDADLRRADQFATLWGTVKTSLNALVIDMGLKVLPMFDQLVGFVAQHVPKIGPVFEFVAEVIAIVMKYVRLMIGDAISWIRGHIIGPFTEWLVSIWQERGPPILEALEALWDGVKALFGAVFDALRGVWDAFILAFQGDWEGAWGKLRETFANLWNQIPDLFAGIWDPLVALADAIMTAVIDTIRAVFGDDVARHFETVWNAVKVVFETYQEVFMGLWRAWSAVFRGDWETAWREFKGVAETIWAAIPVVFEGIINGLIGIVDTVMQAVIGVIRAAFGDQVASIFETAWAAVRTVFEAARDIILGIWQALTAALRGDWEGAWVAIRGIVDTAWGAIQTVIESALSIINTIINGALNGIVALVRWAFGDEAADAVDNGLEVVRTIVDTMTQVILGIVRTFGALMKGDWETAWTEIKNIASIIWISLPTAFEQAMNLLTGVADAVMTAVIDVIRSVFGDEVAVYFERVWTSVKTVFETFQDVILGIWRAFSAAFRGDWQAAWDEAKDVISTVWNAIPGIIEGVLTGLFGIVDAGIQAIIGLIRNQFGDEVASVFQAAWDAVTIVFDTALGAIRGLWNTFSALFHGDWEGAWQSIKDTFSGIWNGIVSIFTGPLNVVTSFITGWAGRIVGSIVALKDLALQYISDLVNGIVEWFSETTLGKTFNWLSDKINGVIGWFAEMYDRVVGHSYIPDMVEEIGQAIQRLREKLQQPVAVYTRQVIESFGTMEEEVVASVMRMAEAMDRALNAIVNTVSKFVSEITREIFNGTATWTSIINSFAGAIGAAFGAIFDELVKELATVLIKQNQWLVELLSQIATSITAYLSQAYAALVAFFAFLGPGAPVAAGAVIASAIAAIAALGGSIIRGLLPEPPEGAGGGTGGPGGSRPSSGRQVSEITGPTRDLLIDLLSPLASLNTLTGIGERIYDLLLERLPAGGAVSHIIIQPGAVAVHVQTSGQITDEQADEIGRRLAERIAFQLRGVGMA